MMFDSFDSAVLAGSSGSLAQGAGQDFLAQVNNHMGSSHDVAMGDAMAPAAGGSVQRQAENAIG